MNLKWVYCPEPKPRADILPISGEEHRHLRVTRIGVGEPVEVFDGNGRVWPGEVIEAGRDATRIRIGALKRKDPPRVQVLLAQAVIRTAPFDWVLEKSVEIGVTRIIPFRAARSNVRGSLREVRWRRIIVEAAKQCRRAHLPRLDPVRTFEEVLAIPANSRLLFSTEGGRGLDGALTGAPVLFCVGPEGGWTPGEIAAARRAGMVQVRLGGAILRSETAALVSAALIAYELGELE